MAGRAGRKQLTPDEYCSEIEQGYYQRMLSALKNKSSFQYNTVIKMMLGFTIYSHGSLDTHERHHRMASEILEYLEK